MRTEILVVEARDDGQISRTSRVNVLVEIRNFRDNSPQFDNDVIHVSIAENTTVGRYDINIKTIYFFEQINIRHKNQFLHFLVNQFFIKLYNMKISLN